MSEMIERIASAIWDARQEVHGRWPNDGPYEDQPAQVQDWVRAEARAAIQAMREPTEDMKARAWELLRGNLRHEEAYRHLIDEALKDG